MVLNPGLTTEQQLVTQLNAIGDQVSTIASDVSQIKNDGNLLKQNLLGGVDGETEHGRIPSAERRIIVLDTRVSTLETAHIKYRAYGAVIGVLSGIASAVVTSAIVLLLQYALLGKGH